MDEHIIGWRAPQTSLDYQEIIERLDRTIEDQADQLKWARETLRDQFAMAALKGMANAAGFQGAPWEKLSRDAYEAADAMLLARQTEETQEGDPPLAR